MNCGVNIDNGNADADISNQKDDYNSAEQGDLPVLT